MPDGHDHTYRNWTQEEDQVVIRECREKTTYANIAQMLGRTTSSVKARAIKLRGNGEHLEELPIDPSLCYMTRGEIAASYRQARFPKDQKRILSQLCCMSVEEITKILEEEGVLLATEKRKPKGYKSGNLDDYRKGQRYSAKEDAEILMGYREGKKAEDIGRPLGRSGLCISARIGMFRRKGMLEKKSPPGRDPDGKKKGNENIVSISQKT